MLTVTFHWPSPDLGKVKTNTSSSRTWKVFKACRFDSGMKKGNVIPFQTWQPVRSSMFFHSSCSCWCVFPLNIAGDIAWICSVRLILTASVTAPAIRMVSNTTTSTFCRFYLSQDKNFTRINKRSESYTVNWPRLFVTLRWCIGMA